MDKHWGNQDSRQSLSEIDSKFRIGARFSTVPSKSKHYVRLPAAEDSRAMLCPLFGMAIPQRHSSPENIVSGQRTFFVTTSTDGKRLYLQSDRRKMLLIEVMFHYRDQGEYRLHDFVVMPDHFHAQITLSEGKTIERAMQLIKGGFAYRARKELGFKGAFWQRGFSEDRVESREEFLAFRKYIHENPVKARLAMTSEEYPYSSAHPRFKQTAVAAKAGSD